MNIAWVTDSTSSIDVKWAKDHNVHIVPLSIIINQVSYKEGLELNTKTFFQKVAETGSHPSSSQPATGDFLELFERLKDEGKYDMVIGIFTSSRLSGTFNNARMSASMVDFPIHLIDSMGSSYLLKYLIVEGQKLIEKGLSVESVIEKLEKLKEDSRVYVLITELEFLHRGGRVSGSQMLLGGLLKIKPIVRLEEGEIRLFDKSRGEAKGRKKMEEYMKQEMPSENVHAAIIHGDCEEDALQWKQSLEVLFPNVAFDLIPLSPTVSVHAGKNSLGVLWLPKL